MKRRKIIHVILLVSMALSFHLLQAQVKETQTVETRIKLAQTSMQFLSVSVDPRAAAMADAVTATEGSAVSMFYNPASMASMEDKVNVLVGQTQWITDINYNHAGIAYQPGNGQYGIVGFHAISVDYGEIQETIRADNDRGFLDLDTYHPSAIVLGVGYARRLTDRFALGGNVKYAYQNLGKSIMTFEGDPAGGNAEYNRKKYSSGKMVFDFGVIYNTGFRSLNFAMGVKQFSTEYTYVEESVELPLNLQVGMSMNLIDLTQISKDVHSFLFSIDATHPRSYTEQIKIGGEYTYANLLVLRAGYISPSDEQGLNLGIGIKSSLGNIGFGFDYAYSQFGAFGTVNRVGINFNF